MLYPTLIPSNSNRGAIRLHKHAFLGIAQHDFISKLSTKKSLDTDTQKEACNLSTNYMRTIPTTEYILLLTSKLIKLH